MERSVEEFMRFFFVMIAERTRPNQRQSVEQDRKASGKTKGKLKTVNERERGGGAYIGHVYARGDGLCGIVVTDKEYPSRVAFTLLNKILDDFASKNPGPDRWAAAKFPELKDYIVRFQDPKQADSIMRVQQELDETKIILHKTIQGVLERGENLENLMDRSEELSNQSKIFLKTARKTNSCCIVM